MNKLFILLQILFIISISAKCQDKDYSKYIKSSLVGKLISEKTNDGSSEVTYLGKITNSKKQIIYYVLNEFNKVQSAIVIHGHSNIIFLDSNKVKIKSYELGTPDELPKSIRNNKLLFVYTDINSKKKVNYEFTIGEVLPKVVCVKPNDCY